MRFHPKGGLTDAAKADFHCLQLRGWAGPRRGCRACRRRAATGPVGDREQDRAQRRREDAAASHHLHDTEKARDFGARLQRDLITATGTCQSIEPRKTDTGMSWSIQCAPEMPLRATASYAFDGAQHYVATVKSEPTFAGKTLASTLTIEGRRIGERPKRSAARSGRAGSRRRCRPSSSPPCWRSIRRRARQRRRRPRRQPRQGGGLRGGVEAAYDFLSHPENIPGMGLLADPSLQFQAIVATLIVMKQAGVFHLADECKNMIPKITAEVVLGAADRLGINISTMSGKTARSSRNGSPTTRWVRS